MTPTRSRPDTSFDPRPPIVVTETDRERLRALVAVIEDGALHAEAAERLSQELERAQVVPSSAVPEDVVTMRSRVVFEDLATGKRREATLVYPSEADASQGRISVLAPVGTALLGLRVGQNVRWPLPSGKDALLVVLAVRYQPEAAGDLQL